jgi:tetraacyldisaccharide 4'-kinase
LQRVWYEGGSAWILLWPIALVYRLVFFLNRCLFLVGLRARIDTGVPVVVVGNISVGGTGKTPLTVWLAAALTERGYRVGIVSRGYLGSATNAARVRRDADPGRFGDEPVMLAQRTACPVAVGIERTEAIALLRHTQRIDVILSDDGLQHWTMRRQCEIAVVDGQRGIGNGRLLPAGPLREPASRLARVDAVVVNGGDWRFEGALYATPEIAELEELISARRVPIAEFRGQTVHAVAGIGHPERFFRLLEAHGIELIRHPRSDHAYIQPDDLRFDDRLPVFLTEKDAVKCSRFAPPDVWCVRIDLSMPNEDREALIELVTSKVRSYSR